MALDAYTNATKRTANPRDIEYRVFGRITGQIMRAMESGDRIAIIKAVSENREFWGALATDCMSDTNQLPDQIKAGIISLSIWVGKYTNEIVSNTDDPQALVDVNKSIMEGLAMTAGADSQADVQASMAGQPPVTPAASPPQPAAPAQPQAQRPAVQPHQPQAQPQVTQPQSQPLPVSQPQPAVQQPVPEQPAAQPQQAIPAGTRPAAPPPRPAVPPAYGPGGGYGAQGQKPAPPRPMNPPQPAQNPGNATPPQMPPRGRTDIKS